MNSPLAQPRLHQTSSLASSGDEMPAPPTHRSVSDPRVAALHPLADGRGDIATSPTLPTKVEIPRAIASRSQEFLTC